MAITASDVKQLRELTGAGMMACKEALKETNGDVESAVDYLRKKGLAAAKKKQSRTAAEGVVTTLIEGDYGVTLEVNCETDFVAKGDDFQGFASTIAKHAVNNKVETIDSLLNETLSTGNKVTEAANELTLKCGEKIDVRRLNARKLTGTGHLGSYNHGGKIGVLVELITSDELKGNAQIDELAKDISMHVAAADPKFLTADQIDEDYKKRESEIYRAQLLEEGKPENMIDKIIMGKLGKLATEVCLMDQKFIKDPDISIKKLIEGKAKELGGTIEVAYFSKMNLGEGIEKREDNLADEVAKMTNKQ